MGAKWVILGTKACLDPGFLREALAEFRDRILVGIDAKAGLIATDGWTRVTNLKAVDLARQVQDNGGRTIIYTDIAKDGGLQGPNLAEIRAMSEAVKLDVIASGGIGSLADLENLKKLSRPNVTGVIIGKAIYEKRFTLQEAIGVCGG
jgi:phosphoribosylformimino-5-aminoimidazole carboxamide ribotide isomerase